MYTYFIVKKGEIASDYRVAEAIKGFKYENDDVVCVAHNGYVSEIETVRSIRGMLNDYDTENIEILAQKYIDTKN